MADMSGHPHYDVDYNPCKDGLILVRDPKSNKIGICSFNGYILLDTICDNISWRGSEQLLIELEIKGKKAICTPAQLLDMADKNGYGEKNNGPRFGADHFESVLDRYKALLATNPNKKPLHPWDVDWESKCSYFFGRVEVGDEFLFPSPCFVREDKDGYQFVTVKIFKAKYNTIWYRDFYPFCFLRAGFPDRPDIRAVFNKDWWSREFQSMYGSNEYLPIDGSACRLFQQLYSPSGIRKDCQFGPQFNGNMQKAMDRFTGVRCRIVNEYRRLVLLPWDKVGDAQKRRCRVYHIKKFYDIDIVS